MGAGGGGNGGGGTPYQPPAPAPAPAPAPEAKKKLRRGLEKGATVLGAAEDLQDAKKKTLLGG